MGDAGRRRSWRHPITSLGASSGPAQFPTAACIRGGGSDRVAHLRGGDLDVGEGLVGPGSHPRRPVHLGLEGERADDAQRAAHAIRIVANKRPRHRGPDIVELRALPLPPTELVTADEAEPGFLRPAREVRGVATTPGIGIAVLVDAFPRILAQRSSS